MRKFGAAVVGRYSAAEARCAVYSKERENG